MRWNKFKVFYALFTPIFLYYSISTTLEKSRKDKDEFCSYCKEIIITFCILFVFFMGVYLALLMEVVKAHRIVRKLEAKLEKHVRL